MQSHAERFAPTTRLAWHAGWVPAAKPAQRGLRRLLGGSARKAARALHIRVSRPTLAQIAQEGQPIETLARLGPALASELRHRGLRTVAELRRVPRPVLEGAFGREAGGELWELARV